MNKHILTLSVLLPLLTFSMDAPNLNIPNPDLESVASTIGDSQSDQDNLDSDDESTATTVPGDGDMPDAELMEEAFEIYEAFGPKG